MLRTITIVAAAGVSSQAFASDASRIAAVSPEAVRLTHVYHNAATGETIFNRHATTRGNTGPVWMANSLPTCPGGQSLAGVIIADQPADAGSLGSVYMNWGDIAPDTLVRAVQFSFGSDYNDPDSDGDGLPDGVPGLGVRLVFYRGENGIGGNSATEEVGVLEMMGMPGRTSPFGIEGYSLTVDLAEGIALGSLDVDGDGLADFGYSLETIHPTGQAARRTYQFLGGPSGQAVPDGQGGWTVVADPAPNAQGTEDAIDVYRRDDQGAPVYFETIGGQFSCDAGQTGMYAQIALSLFGETAAACTADLNGDSLINFFDLSLFIQWFNAADPRADVFPAGGDGVFNFFDVSAYLALFNAGCP